MIHCSNQSKHNRQNRLRSLVIPREKLLCNSLVLHNYKVIHVLHPCYIYSYHLFFIIRCFINGVIQDDRGGNKNTFKCCNLIHTTTSLGRVNTGNDIKTMMMPTMIQAMPKKKKKKEQSCPTVKVLGLKHLVSLLPSIRGRIACAYLAISSLTTLVCQ